MADYHFVYKDEHSVSTEWDEIQRKLGNLPTKPPAHKSEPWQPAEDASKNKQWIDSKSEEELQELEDDVDDDRFLEEYRKKRMAELSGMSKKPRFGSVLAIRGADFLREVSQAPAEIWVVVHLYKDGIAESEILQQMMAELAPKYPDTKFVKIISTDCIPNYPDFNVPTVIVYKNSCVVATIVGLREFGGRRCTPEDVAFRLCQIGHVLGGDGNAVSDKVKRDYLERIISTNEL